MLQTRPKPWRHGAGRLLGLLLGLLVAAAFGAWAVLGQQNAPPLEMLTEDLDGDDPLHEIRIQASEISEWQEGNDRVILMRGQVLVQHDLVGLYLKEGIAWISTEHGNGAAPLYHVDVYGEKADFVQQGKMRRQAHRARVKMTANRYSLKIFGGNEIQRQNAGARNDPLFARALTVLRGAGWAQAAAVPNLAALPQNGASPFGGASSGLVLTGGQVSDATGSGIQQAATPIVVVPPQSPLGQPLPSAPLPGGSQPPPYAPLPPLPGSNQPPSYVPSASPLPALGQPVPSVPLPGSGQPLSSSPQAPFPPLPSSSPDIRPLPVPPSPAVLGTIDTPPPPSTPPSAPARPETQPVPVQLTPIPAPQTVSQVTPGPVPAPLPEAADSKTKAPAPVRIVQIRSRTGGGWSASKEFRNGEWVYLVPTGIYILVRDAATDKILIDIEADRLVYWSKDGSTGIGDDAMEQMKGSGAATNTMEFYLSGHVQIRNQRSAKEAQYMRADEVYYDVSRNVAVAINANVQLTSPMAIYPTYFTAKEMKQIGPKRFEGTDCSCFSSMFPSDPGIKILFSKAVFELLDTPRPTIFGQYFTKMKDWQPDTTPQKIVTGDNAVLYLENVPISYFPKFKADADRPLGPLDGIGFNYSSIFGFQLLTTWNVFELIGIIPDAGKKWQLYADYMTARGPHVGTFYHDEGKDIFKEFTSWNNKYDFTFKADGQYDTGIDQIGGARGTQEQITPNLAEPITHPDFRGRVFEQFFVQDLPNGFTFQQQFAAISDVNYLDQFYNPEWLNNMNQETFAYLKQQKDFWYWSVLAEDRIRPWITETSWLPKLDGYVAGVDLFDMATWNSKVGIGYAQLKIADTTPPVSITDQNVNTARADWWQDVSLPFNVGDGKLVPYAVTDLTYYSQDLAGDQIARFYGGLGLRGSMPLSKLYPDIQSDLFNLDGIYHKIVLAGNYYYAYSNVHYDQLPQLDRLNDDPSDQALRDIRPLQSQLNPSNAFFLNTSKLFDPQFYALQRLVMTQVDTLDSIDVLELDLNQRWQTRRGVAGDEHVVDWMTLDLSAAIYPQAQRDNFNQPIGFLAYNWLWNIGDRTSLFSNAWLDPISGGPHFFTMGAAYNRPDKTNFTLSYRQIDPLDSKAVIATVTYPLSAKYAVTGSTLYDFGVNTQTNTIMLTRIGTDLRFSVGFSYNSILNNFSAVVEIVPNLFPNAGRGGVGASGGGIGSTR